MILIVGLIILFVISLIVNILGVENLKDIYYTISGSISGMSTFTQFILICIGIFIIVYLYSWFKEKTK